MGLGLRFRVQGSYGSGFRVKGLGLTLNPKPLDLIDFHSLGFR